MGRWEQDSGAMHGMTGHDGESGPTLLRLEQLEVFGIHSKEQERTARRRFLTLFEDTSQKQHRGGQGMVTKVTNANGEVFALKRLVYGMRQPGMSDEAYLRLRQSQEEAFKQEYLSQQVPSNIEGFPTLYGYGSLDGAPIILMEWIDGVTLSKARKEMSVNPQTLQWQPVHIAELGIAMFSLFTYMEHQKTSFVHRDISPNNIMFRTNHRSITEQFAQGDLDLCLIDFGSAATIAQFAASSFTQSTNVLRRATLDYAAPEMLTDDIPKRQLTLLRSSPSIDVYATCSVLYELFGGYTPFNFYGGETIASPYLHKLEARIPMPGSAHEDGSGAQWGQWDAELARLQGRLHDSTVSPFDHDRFAASVRRVDQQLALIIMGGLRAEQRERPTAREMLGFLQNFKTNYYRNIERCYNGESIIPFRQMGSSGMGAQVPMPYLKRSAASNPYADPWVITRQDPSVSRQSMNPVAGGTSIMPSSEGGGTTLEPGLQKGALRMRRGLLGGLIGGSSALIFVITLVLASIPSDLYYSLHLLSTGFSGSIPTGLAALISVMPPLVSFACMWPGTTPDGRLFAGTMAQVVASLPWLLFIWLARWAVPSAPALLGLALILSTVIVFVTEFYIRSASISSSKGVRS
ncbi:MAG: AarF/UbiB family protein [Actinomycetota bacterium]|nr:AarF/UbiB family protein [Actinomycetota bacterium]